MAVAKQANVGRSRFQKARRRWVKHHGRRLLRRMNRLFASQSLVPVEPVLDSSEFPWARELEERWQDVRAEAERVLAHRKHLPKIYEIAPDQKRIGKDKNWLSFAFYGYGYRSDAACRMCPVTAEILDRIPDVETAFFSILQPGARVPRHQGLAKGVIRCHLGLMVPDERERCVIHIDDVPHTWEEGRNLIFDDTYYHEVSNDTDQDRVVLLFDFHRPMRPLGRLVNRLALGVLRRTAVVQDAVRMTRAWEREFLGQA